ncbi:MAG: CBS domain-containing protein [Candidatus Helarchaeales archaeon]
MLVKEVMNDKPISISLPNSRDAALEIFEKTGVKSLPVLKNDELIGIITHNDLLLKPSEDQLALLMTRNPVVVTPNDDVRKAIRLLIDKNLRRLPVVEKKRLVGIFSVEDLIRKIQGMKIKDPIGPYITRTFTTIWEGTPLSVVPTIFRLARVHALPVLDSEGRLSGIITVTDLFNETEVITENSKSVSGGSGQDWDWNAASTLLISQQVLKLPDKTVKEIMTREIVSTIESKAISDCAAKMIKLNLNSMPVLDPKDDRLIGIIHDRELIKVLLKEE